MSRPLLLDLFCGAGGAAMGYHRAGFDIIGIDIDPQPHYPFAFLQGDVMRLVGESFALERFDVIHASPPCQAHTTMSNRNRGDWPDLLEPTYDLLDASGLPWVLENVPGARSKMRSPMLLHGGMFGLEVHRPRLFDSNMLLTAQSAPVVTNPVGIYGAPDGRRLWTRADGTEQRAWTWEDRHLIGMGHVDDPADWHDVAEAIPPAYTEHIGRQLLAHLEVAA